MKAARAQSQTEMSSKVSKLCLAEPREGQPFAGFAGAAAEVAERARAREAGDCGEVAAPFGWAELYPRT